MYFEFVGERLRTSQVEVGDQNVLTGGREGAGCDASDPAATAQNHNRAHQEPPAQRLPQYRDLTTL